MARPLPRSLPEWSAIDIALILCRIRRLAGARNCQIARVLGVPAKALVGIDKGQVPDQVTAYALLQLLHHIGGDTQGL